MPELPLVLLEHLRDGRLVPLMERVDLFLRGIFHPLDADCLADDEVLRLALVRQEAVETANRPDEPDPELPLDEIRSGYGELGAIQWTCRIWGGGLGIRLGTTSVHGNYKLRHLS